MNTIVKGIVKFFNEEKGFGFIIQDGTKKEIFVHRNETKEYLQENDEVQFVIATGNKGPFASQVEIVQ